MKTRALFLLLSIFFVHTVTYSADYYWVGGSGNWDDLTHWAISSGGPTSHTQIPTALDNVYFDANSFTAAGQNVTLNVNPALCHSMNWTGALHNPSLAGQSNGLLKIYGSLTLIDAMSITYTGDINMEATGMGKTIQTNGKTLANNIFFMGNGGGWTLLDSLIITNNKSIYHHYGSLNTNGKKISAYRYSSTVSNNRSLNLGSSEIWLTSTSSSAFSVYLVNLILNAGTSTIRLVGSSGSSGGGVYIYDSYTNLSAIFYNVEFHSITGTSTLNCSGTSQVTFNNVQFFGDGNINGSSTFSNLMLGGGKNYLLQAGKTQTIVNNLSVYPLATCDNITTIQSSTNGTATNISKSSGSIMLEYLNLRDVHAIGGASFTANNSNDLGNNTGWTIQAPSSRDLYWVGGSGDWDDKTHWSLTSGGVGGECIPGPVDDVFFDANSFSSSAQNVNISANDAICRDMIWTGAQYNPTLAGNNSNKLKIYGSLELISNMTVSFTGEITFEATSTGKTIRTSNNGLPNNIYFLGSGGGWSLLDDLTLIQNKSIYFHYGSLNTNSHDIECYRFSSTVSNPRNLSMGSSLIEVTSTSSSAFSVYLVNLILNAGTSTIRCSGNSNTSAGGMYIYDSYTNLNCTFYNVEFLSGTGTATLNVSGTTIATFNYVYFEGDGNINGTSNFDALTLTSGRKYELQSGKTQTIYSNFNVLPSNNCNRITILQAQTNGTNATISKSSGSINVDYCVLRDVHGVGGASFNALNSVDLGNTTGWTINQLSPRTLYWVWGTGNWDDPQHWSLSSNGTAGQCIPTPVDNVIFDNNSFIGQSNHSVFINVEHAFCKDMRWIGNMQNPTLGGSSYNTLKIYGSLELNPTMNITFTGDIELEATNSGNTIETKGNQIISNLFFLGPGGEWSLMDSLILSNNKSIYHHYGTFNTNNHRIKTYRYSSTVSNQRSLNLGSSLLECTSTSSSAFSMYLVNMNLNAGTSLIRLTGNSGSSAGGVYLYDSYTNLSASLYDIEFASNSGTSTLNVSGTTQASFHDVYFNTSGNINGNSSFHNLTFTPDHTYILQENKTQVINNNFHCQGSCTSYIIMQSKTQGTPTNIYKANGIIKGYNIHMRDVTAQGGASFNAYNSVDLGGNPGWNFQILPPLANPQSIFGDTALCVGQTGVQYSIPAVSGALNYNWSVPAGAQITLGQGDTLILVDFTGPVNDSIHVIAHNGCNGSSISSLPVSAASIQLQPLQDICYSNQAILLQGGTPAGGTYFGTGVSNGYFHPQIAGIGNHTIYYAYISSACNDTVSQNIQVFQGPQVAFSGLGSVCQNSAPIALGTGIPAGGIYSGPGVNSGLFDPQQLNPGFFTLTYSYTDSAGCSGNDTTTVEVLESTQLPQGIIGNDTLCTGGDPQAYSTFSSNATGYIWSINPSNAGTIYNNGSNSVDIAWNPAFSGTAVLSVAAYGQCDTSNTVSLNVYLMPVPNAPVVINGPSAICISSGISNYSTPGFQGQGTVWTLIPASAGNIIGSGDSIQIAWDSAFSGNVELLAAHYTVCDTSLSISQSIIATAIPGPLNFIGGTADICQGLESSLITAQCPNSSGFIWNLQPISAGSINGNTGIATASWDTNYTGPVTIEVWAYNSCDTIGPSVISFNVYPRPGIPIVTQYGFVLESSTAPAYQWHQNGLPIPGAINQQYTVVQTGSYFVVVSNQYGCTDTSAHFYISVITEIPTTDPAEGIRVFPNPSSHSFTIQWDKLKLKRICFMDAAGRILYQQIPGEKSIIHYEAKSIGLSAGMYIISFETDKGILKKRLLLVK